MRKCPATLKSLGSPGLGFVCFVGDIISGVGFGIFG